MGDLSAEILGDTPVRRLVDDFALLGHLEIANGVSWRIAPPVLAGLPSDCADGPSAVLCGARTRGVLASLDTACRSAGAHMAVTLVPDRPSIVRVCAVVRRRSSMGANPTRQLSLRPEATGAVMEVTKWLKPSV
jgi:hypothetical protein